MIAGLPGTGIGGIFYMLLVVWMPARELWLAVTGRSSRRRWRLIGIQAGLAAGIMSALWAEAWLLKWLFASLPGWANGAGFVASTLQRLGSYGAEFIPPALVLAPFAILFALVVALHLLRIAMRRAPAVRASA